MVSSQSSTRLELPEIVELSASLQRYESPRVFHLRNRLREVREAVEVIVRTSRPIPATAITPVLYIGDVPLEDYETMSRAQYRFFGAEPERLREGAPISFGYPYIPHERHQRVRFRFRLGPPLVS
jgi:hypothetical protein